MMQRHVSDLHAPWLFLALLFVADLALGDVIDSVYSKAHLGPATCATSQCHGKNAPVDGKNVLLNEYTTWLESDRHSIAYKTLETKQSNIIAKKLGIENPRKAKICLDCHADNVPVENRGEKFQLSDGVGCESCHGGSVDWIKTHTNPDASHAKNVQAGMIELEIGTVRAQVCLSCHLGTKDKYATHQIMGAGHPRLSFEMSLFTENQPAHYMVDDDYIQRKGNIQEFNLWLLGQLESARQTLKVAMERMHDGIGLFPDFAFYDCHSCHHSQKIRRWTNSRADGLAPGSLRFHLPNLAVIDAIADALGTADLRKAINRARLSTLKGAQISKKEFKLAATSLLQQLDVAQQLWTQDYPNAEIKKVRRALLDKAAADQASDYAEAEQVYFSIETLCIALDDYANCESDLGKLIEQIDNSDTFSPREFAKTAKSIAAGY